MPSHSKRRQRKGEENKKECPLEEENGGIQNAYNHSWPLGTNSFGSMIHSACIIHGVLSNGAITPGK